MTDLVRHVARDLLNPATDDFFGLRRANSLFNELEDWFDIFGKGKGFSRFDGVNIFGFIPPMQIVDERDKWKVLVEVPGIPKEEIEISLENEGNLGGSVLVLSGEKKIEKDDKDCSEFSYGKFRREVSVPYGVKTEEIDATYKDGVLTISLPKEEKTEVLKKKIDIK